MYQIKELSNGIKVLLENMENLNSVSLGVYYKTGSVDEMDNEQGVAHLLEHMVFKGTKTRSAKDISEEIDLIGGHINAYTSKEITAFYTVTLAEYVEKSIEILADILNNSTFTEENLEKEKKVVIEEIRMYQDMPEDLVHDINSEEIVSGALGRNILGTEESVNSISRETLVNYFQKRYTSNNMVISIVGAIDFDSIIELLEKYFVTERENIEVARENVDFTIKPSHNIIRKDINQVHLCFNTKGLSYLDKNKYVLSVISNILGGNMSSRLFQKIREERGLCYSVYTYVSSYKNGGLFTVYVGTTKEDYKEVLEMIKEEFEDIKNNGVSLIELQKAKNQLLSSMIIGLETSKSRMSRMANNYIAHGRVLEIEEIIKEVNSVDEEKIVSLAKEIFKEEYYSSTVLGEVNEEN